VAELHRQEMARLLERLPAEVSRVRGREWLELTTTMERGRDRALALVPPARRALRVLPDESMLEPVGAVGGDSPPTASLVRPDLVRAASGGESPA
jgi:hypothetical protein